MTGSLLGFINTLLSVPGGNVGERDGCDCSQDPGGKADMGDEKCGTWYSVGCNSVCVGVLCLCVCMYMCVHVRVLCLCVCCLCVCMYMCVCG